MSSSSDLFDNKLHLAVHCSDIDAAKKTLKDGTDPNIIGLFGWNALHEAASNGDLELLTLLLQYGGDCNKKDLLKGYTPLHYASSEGHSECLEYLISQGGDVSMESSKGRSVSQVTRHKSCKKVLTKFGVPVINTVRFEKRSTKHVKSSKNQQKNAHSGSLPKLSGSSESHSLTNVNSFRMKSLSANLSDEFLSKSCSSLQSLTSLGSSIDETIAGYITLAFQYNRKTARLIVSVSNIILTCLKMYEKQKKDTVLTLQIKGVIYMKSNAEKEIVVKSEYIKLYSNGTEECPIKDEGSRLETYWSSETAYIKFLPSMNLDFFLMDKNDIPMQSIKISLLMQRRKSLLKSLSQCVTIATMELPLQDALKRIMKERYELDFSVEDTDSSMIEPMLSEIVIDNESVISDSVIIGIRRPTVIDTTRCVSDSDLKTVTTETSRLNSKRHRSPHSAITIPSDESKYGLNVVESHVVPPSPEVHIKLPPPSDGHLEDVVSQ